MQPIHWAASDGKIASIRFLLDHRVDINAQDGNGCTAVTIASQHNQTPCVAFLVKNGADVSLRDMNGDTALHWAAYKGHAELVGLLTHCCPQELDSDDVYGQVTFVHSSFLDASSCFSTFISPFILLLLHLIIIYCVWNVP